MEEKSSLKIKEKIVLEKYDGDYSSEKEPIEIIIIEDGKILEHIIK